MVIAADSVTPAPNTEAQATQPTVERGVDSIALLPGSVVGTIVNVDADLFEFPSSTRFRISVAGSPQIWTEAELDNGVYTYVLDGVPAGAQTLVLQEMDADGNIDTLDFFQQATRRSQVEVISADTVEASFELLWHWQRMPMDGASAHACQQTRALAFVQNATDRTVLGGARRGYATITSSDVSDAPAPPLGSDGLAYACSDNGSCISIGPHLVAQSFDGFETYDTFSALPPGFGCSSGIDTAQVVWVPDSDTAWIVVSASGCAASGSVRRVTTDGGETWGAWEPSPVSAGGSLQFANASTAFALEDDTLYKSTDGGETFRSTGSAPHPEGAGTELELDVLDADQAWVSAASDECDDDAPAPVDAWRWVP